MKKTMKDFDLFEEVDLGFDPKSKEMKTFLTNITPTIAAYILANHNKDNRKVVKSQVKKIAKSIREDGWLEDGQPLTFNVDGNITEFQHRLLAIIEAGVTIRCVVVLGVAPGCFTKCAPAKPRKAEDEIQRKDKTATQSEASTLRQLLKRRQGNPLTIQNAIDKWIIWREYVRSGRTLVDGFFDSVSEYDSWERTFAAWAALMGSINESEVAETFLSLLQSEILDDESACCLTREFKSFFEDNSVYLSATGRTDMVYYLLCIASDRLKKQSDGEILLGVTVDKLTHDTLKKSGFYRKFLENVDNIQISKPPF